MTGFQVDPQAIRKYAEDLAAARRAVDAAKSYVNSNGTFGGHEKGLIGMVVGSHDNFVSALNQMLAHLMDLTDASEGALKQLATRYEQSDKGASAAIDATYPAVLRVTYPAG